MLQAFDIPPVTPLTDSRGVAQVVFLHGLGANGRDLTHLIRSLGLPHCHFWLPDAPLPHPQVPDGRAWFELDQWRGLDRSCDLLKQWLMTLEEHSGIPLAQTVLAGFSQGGAMALKVGLSLEPSLAGVVCLSGFMVGAPELTQRQSPVPPALIVHGRQDPVVLLDYARQSKQILEMLEFHAEYYELDCGHEVPDAAIALVAQFIKRIPAVT